MSKSKLDNSKKESDLKSFKVKNIKGAYACVLLNSNNRIVYVVLEYRNISKTASGGLNKEFNILMEKVLKFILENDVETFVDLIKNLKESEPVQYEKALIMLSER